MIGKTNLGGSGGGLNFKVVGGTMVPSGHENLIWVNTATKITSWVVSPSQPATPIEGMVWIHDGSDNGINILKKNAVEVFPSLCQQYVDGLWSNAEAYLYTTASGWVQFSQTILTLFDNGNEYTSITGGWTKTAVETASGGVYFDTATTGTISKGTSLKMSGSKSGDSTLLNSYRPVNKIDVTNYTTMRIYGTFSASGPSGWSQMALYRDRPFSYYQNVIAQRHVDPNNVSAVNAQGYVDVDITSVTGLVTIILGIFCYGYKGTSSASYTISKVELI